MRNYWVFSAALGIVWALVLVLAFAIRGAAAWPFAVIFAGYAFAWGACTIAREVIPPPAKWLPADWHDPRGPLGRMRTWTTLSLGVLLGWLIPMAFIFAARGAAAEPMLVLFGGFAIGWIACTIARYVYPPPARWRSAHV